MINQNDSRIKPLLCNLENVPKEYIRQVAEIKRVLERWVSDPAFQAMFNSDPVEAIASLGVDVKPEEITPLIYTDEAFQLNESIKAGKEGKYPVSVLRYRAFSNEKLAHRSQIKMECRSSDSRIAAWRDRQVNRCVSELGYKKADAIVHAPVAFEISKGCTVGCWFCGVEAPKFDHNWTYTNENATFWRETLLTLQGLIGSCIKSGFLYWATDPLDNPDYEKFARDFWKITGNCPQTTTALGVQDPERTRKLLDFTRTLDSHVDRFSVLSLKMLKKIHDSFTPEELIRVECIPQNREAKDRYLKAMAGRARKYKVKKGEELTNGKQGDTIACVSGFLFNMVDKTVKLITPCQTVDRWPLGYWILAEASFNSPEDLKKVITEIVDKHIKTRLDINDKVQLRPDLKWEVEGDKFKLITDHLAVTFPFHKNPESLMHLLEKGSHTQEEIAQIRERKEDVALAETFFLLQELFTKGFIYEEPQPIRKKMIELTVI